MPPSHDERILFSWLHLSDIHFGHGDEIHQFNQIHIVRELLEDVSDLTQQRLVPSPQTILLTGDIAYKGSSTEYLDAERWLLKLISALHLKRRNLFVIPGNHDVQRTLSSDRQVFRLVNALRSEEPLDPALRDPIDRTALTKRFENYLTFAQRFAPACMNPIAGAEQWLFWSHRLQPQSDFGVHILGLNSALLCNNDEDSRKLLLGTKQMESLIERRPRSGEIVLVLTHHPLQDLRDASSEHVAAIATKAEIHLSGHVHDPSLKRIQPGSGGSHIDIVAGAVHGEPGLREQGYSFAAIVQTERGSLELRIWPRRWFARPQRFAWDLENTNKGQNWAGYPLESSTSTFPERFPHGSIPILDPLPGFGQSKATQSDILDPESARDWLSTLGFDQHELFLPGNVVIEGDRNSEQLPQIAAAPWNALVVKQICDLARSASKSNVTPILLHGIRGVGKSLLALRYVASGTGNDIRLFVDCGSNPEGVLDDLRRELKAELLSISPIVDAASEVFIVIDGLDIACRSQAVKEREPRAEKLLDPEVGAFRRMVNECLPGRRVYLMFTSDDGPEWQAKIATSESWATACFREIMVEDHWQGISCRLEPHTVFGPGFEALRNVVLRRFSEDQWMEHPFLVLPVFFDAIRNANPASLRHLSTRRHFLGVGSEKAKPLGKRRHIYYKTLEDVDNFIKALNALPAVPIVGDNSFDKCVGLIEKELTGDWMYLFELSDHEEALIGRLEQLHKSLIEDPWRYSDTYALSNIVSILALLGHFHVEDKKYLHCNLRNAQIINAAQIIRSQFHGVDLGGAKILGATIVDGKFVGVDFTGATFEDSVLTGKSAFIGCRFDKGTFDQRTLNVVQSEPGVRFIESIPEGWSPS